MYKCVYVYEHVCTFMYQSRIPQCAIVFSDLWMSYACMYVCMYECMYV